MYQHIEFIDGSNPYISKTEKDFKWMCEHYVLIPIAENFWKATDRIYYKVVGFANKNKMATFNRNYKSKAGAMRVIRKAIKENKFECIVLRKEVEDLRNDEHFDISVSTPIKTWNLAQIGVMEMKLDLIMIDECGDEVKVETFNVGNELDEDYMELWKDRKIEKARENYPEAQQFYFERPYSDMSYGELLACGDF